MDVKEIQGRVFSIIAAALGKDVNDISMNSKLEDLGADSLDSIELIMKFEEEFGISISDDVAEKLKTVDDIVNYVERNVTEG